MLPRPACHRAVQRRSFSPTESIWISDEAVRQVFEHFARGSKDGRRYGSFVPGPMESRRRLGKRRMTLQADASRIPTFHFGLFRGWFGERDRTQWQWEAPSTRAPNVDVIQHTLLSWLLEWVAIPSKAAQIPMVTNHVKDGRKKLSFSAKEVAAFRLELETCSGDCSVICDAFIQKTRQGLRLGIMSEEVLRHILTAVPEMILQQDLVSTEAHSYCLQLYHAVWEGIECCKVLPSEALHGETLNKILKLVCQLPMTAESRKLGTRIIYAASTTQLSRMKAGIDRLVVTWMRTLLDAGEPLVEDRSLLEVTEAVIVVKQNIEDIQRLLSSTQSGNTLGVLGERLCEAKASLRLALNRVQVVEDTMSPLRRSTCALVSLLQHLPHKMVRSILRSLVQYTSDNAFDVNDISKDMLQRHFLSLAAQLSAVEDKLFEEFLNKTTCSIKPAFFSRLVLDQWISQGYIKDAAVVRNSYEVTADATRQTDVATLLAAVNKHKEACWTKLRGLVVLIHALGKQRTTYQTTIRLHVANIKIPADIMGPILESVSTFDAKMALNLYHLFFAMRANFTPVRPELCPSFVIALINDPGVKPETIWKIVGIPVYAYTLNAKRFAFSKKKLAPEMIRLINKMAVAFAHSNRPSRVAFRNVEQCLHYLRRHGASIDSDLTRSIIHSGVTGKIMEGRWIPVRRSSWILGLVERVEGTQVALTADGAVNYWNETISEARRWERRESNPLQVGPID